MGPIRSMWVRSTDSVDREGQEEEGLNAWCLALPAGQPSQVLEGGDEASSLTPRRGGLLDLTAFSASQLR